MQAFMDTSCLHNTPCACKACYHVPLMGIQVFRYPGIQVMGRVMPLAVLAGHMHRAPMHVLHACSACMLIFRYFGIQVFRFASIHRHMLTAHGPPPAAPAPWRPRAALSAAPVH